MSRYGVIYYRVDFLPGGWFPGGIVCREASVLGGKFAGRKIYLMGEVCWEDAHYGRGR